MPTAGAGLPPVVPRPSSPNGFAPQQTSVCVVAWIAHDVDLPARTSVAMRSEPPSWTRAGADVGEAVPVTWPLVLYPQQYTTPWPAVAPSTIAHP